MLGQRIIYSITLVVVFIFYVFYVPWFSWYLLVLVLLIVPLDLIVSLPGMLTKTVVLSAPTILEKGSSGVLTVASVHLKPYPIRGIKVKLRVTGDDFAANCKALTGSENNSHSEIEIDTNHTGLTVFQVKRASAVSLIGLFSLPISLSSRAGVLILPPAHRPANTPLIPRGVSLQAKPGGGFSEEHDMRDYRRGDPVRSIHWKLSAKLNSLIIREPLVPPSHSRLIQVAPWNDAAERDEILGHLRFISEYLLERDMAYFVRFSDKDGVAEITQESDLYEFLRHSLGYSSAKKPAFREMPSRFSWIYRVGAGKDSTEAAS